MKSMWMPYLVLLVGTSLVLAAISATIQSEPYTTTIDENGNGHDFEETPNRLPDSDEFDQERIRVLEEPVQDCDRLTYFTNEYDVIEHLLKVRKSSNSAWMKNPAGYFFSGRPPIAHSFTNVQVEGVDEPDIAKTDGEYIYTISGRNVTILRAYPPEVASLKGRISFDSSPSGLFIDGDRLIVLLNIYYSLITLQVYNISNPSSPELIREVSVEGYYSGSRMRNGYVYLIALYNILITHDGNYYGFKLPELKDNSRLLRIHPWQIAYFNNEPIGEIMVILLALPTSGRGSFGLTAYLGDRVGKLYASTNHFYLANTFYRPITIDNETRYFPRSTIHKVAYERNSFTYVCSGEVPGWLLNQFSMDEYHNNLRVATTVSFAWHNTESSIVNNVYVLDHNLNTIGRLEALAPGEQIYSARFNKDKVYLVTFKKVDPFFVIDLSNPSEPEILGYLKIPGFSNYLHPYDENHVIGIGKDTVEGEGGNFAWFQGLKLSLFDVTNVTNPQEISKVVIGERGTTSEVLNDHKALLFIEERHLLIIPVDLAQINMSRYPNGPLPWVDGEYVWQGAYIFSVSPGQGFILQGHVTHGELDRTYNLYQYPFRVRRSVYIEDVLYTISESLVKINHLSDLVEIDSIPLL